MTTPAQVQVVPTLVTQQMIDEYEMEKNIASSTPERPYLIPEFNLTSEFVGDTYSMLLNTDNGIPSAAQIKDPNDDANEGAGAYAFKWNGVTRILLPVTQITKPDSNTEEHFKISKILVKTSGVSLHLDENKVSDEEITEKNILQDHWKRFSQSVGTVGAQYTVALLTGQELVDELQTSLGDLVSADDAQTKINGFLNSLLQVDSNEETSTYNVKPRTIKIAETGAQSPNVIPQPMAYNDAYMGTYALSSADAKTVPIKTGVICETKAAKDSQIPVVKIPFKATPTGTGSDASLKNATIKPSEITVATQVTKSDLETMGIPSVETSFMGYIAAMLRIDVPEDFVQEIYWSYGSQGYKVGVWNATQQIACQIAMN